MMQPAEADIMLPNGYWHEGVCLREARVRAISQGEIALEGSGRERLPIERVSGLLSRCVTHLGGRLCEGSEQLRLPMGDREVLLLQIRRLTFGDRLPCTLHCPSCTALMDFQLQVHELILPGEQQPSQYHEEPFKIGETTWRARFRVPCGADVEAAIHIAGGTPREAILAVLHSCIEWVRGEGTPGAESIPAAQWPAEFVSQIAARMSCLDPQAEVILQLRCPTCGHEFCSLFDIGDYFLRELAAAERQLYYDIHRIALAYHWSEAEILNMTPHKRMLYLGLLEGVVDGE